MNWSERQRSRKFWLNFHLVLALSAGFIFALLGLTGSISMYREEIDQRLNPELVIEKPQGSYQSLDKIINSVRAAHPDRHGEWTLEMPLSKHDMMTAWFEKPRETYFEGYAPLMVSINPYTAEVVVSRFWGHTFTTWALDMHTQLLMGERGWNLVGWCGLLLPFSVFTGLYLWWPGIRQMPSVLKIKCNAGLMRLLLDLHRFFGVLSAPILILLAVTGINLSFPSLLENLASTSGMAHGSTGKVIISTAHPNDQPTMLEAAQFVAQSAFPDGELRRITTPDGTSGVFRINFRQKDEINRRHPYATVWIDRWSGQVKEVRTPAKFNAGETLITWMWPLHTGEAVGKFGRLCWFLAGQSLFFLYVSGLCRWLSRSGRIEDSLVKPNIYHISPNFRRIVSEIFLLVKNFLHCLLKLSKIIGQNHAYPELTRWLIKSVSDCSRKTSNKSHAIFKEQLLPLAHVVFLQVISSTRSCLTYIKINLK